tara:strand:- start:358 stop:1071 length:714 start_codon:yes stop_codon:yes gene_type:complete
MVYEILKIRDPSDKNFTPKNRLFDLPFRIALIGKSQFSLGKTTIILNLLLRDKFYGKDFQGENIYIVSNNKADKKLLILAETKEIPDCNIMSFDEATLEALYEIIEEQFEDEKKKQNRLIIFDDVVATGGLKQATGIVSKMIMQGRHIGLSQIYTSQKYSLLSTGLRSNITGAMIGGLSNKELELVEQDMNFLDNKKKFMTMIRNNTKNKRDFVIFNFSNDENEVYMNKKFEPIKGL